MVQLRTLGFQHKASISLVESLSEPILLNSVYLSCPLHRASSHTGQEQKENERDSAKNCKVAKAREVLSLKKTEHLSEANCSFAVFARATWKGVKGSKM